MRCSSVALVILALSAPTQVRAEGFVGAKFYDDEEHVVVGAVDHLSPAGVAGLAKGDVVLSIGGKPVKTAQAARELVEKTEVDKYLRFEIRTVTGRKTIKIRVDDAEKWQKLFEEDKRNAATAAKQAAEAAAKLQEQIKQEGPITYAGVVKTNTIGLPEILLRLENISNVPVEAIEFHVAVFDKFGEAVPDAFADGHRKIFKYQQTLNPRTPTLVTLNIPWHQTAGKAHVVVNRVVMTGDKIITPPAPRVIEVRR